MDDRTGHDLAAEQIAKHGRDRYPTAERQFLKLVAEIGELAEALDMNHGGITMSAELRAEYADVGLSLFALGSKMRLDLLECMREVVDRDERKF